MAHPSSDVIYQLHIQLAYIEPPIWRRLVVSGQITLFTLHQMLQVVMGWENSHLHQFIVGKTHCGEPDPEVFSVQQVNSALGMLVSLTQR